MVSGASNPASDTSSDVRAHILDCAVCRFQQFGFGKSTMAEIAGDAGMSAANLYRYFVNKQDLGAACAERCMGELLTALRAVLNGHAGSAAQCLEELVLTMLRWTHHHAANQPRINELVDMIARERGDIVHRRDNRVDALLAEVLARGNESGEFDVEDVIGQAQAVHAAVRIFEVPVFMGLYDLPTFERRARDVVALLVSGLAKR